MNEHELRQWIGAVFREHNWDLGLLRHFARTATGQRAIDPATLEGAELEEVAIDVALVGWRVRNGATEYLQHWTNLRLMIRIDGQGITEIKRKKRVKKDLRTHRR